VESTVSNGEEALKAWHVVTRILGEDEFETNDQGKFVKGTGIGEQQHAALRREKREGMFFFFFFMSSTLLKFLSHTTYRYRSTCTSTGNKTTSTSRFNSCIECTVCRLHFWACEWSERCDSR
jgi:hypothetical protein